MDGPVEAIAADGGDLVGPQRWVLRLEFEDRLAKLVWELTPVGCGWGDRLEEAGHTALLKALDTPAQRALRGAGLGSTHRRGAAKQHDGTQQFVGLLLRRGDPQPELVPVVGGCAFRAF